MCWILESARYYKDNMIVNARWKRCACSNIELWLTNLIVRVVDGIIKFLKGESSNFWFAFLSCCCLWFLSAHIFLDISHNYLKLQISLIKNIFKFVKIPTSHHDIQSATRHGTGPKVQLLEIGGNRRNVNYVISLYIMHGDIRYFVGVSYKSKRWSVPLAPCQNDENKFK